nr:hypothetical protein [Pantoea conspicua]
MNYVLIYLLLVPFRTLMRLFYRPTGRNLIIQTAKIGDFINITPMLRALGQSELLISKAVEPLVRHDDTVSRYFLIEEAKRSFFAKLKLAFTLMNRYDNVYLVQPNSVNLFLHRCVTRRTNSFCAPMCVSPTTRCSIAAPAALWIMLKPI